MAYTGLTSFIDSLEKNNELVRIKAFVDPVLEIAEIADRVTKSGSGKALLFENTGTSFPMLINAFGSEKRMALATGGRDFSEAGTEIERILGGMTGSHEGFLKKISFIPELARIASFMPSRSQSKGACQDVIHNDPDLSALPVLKCWPHDGGRFITLPLVHTVHPLTGKNNLGMYRMQVLDKKTTAMHWQRHKTGANHFEAWKKTGMKMPVSVSLGGDPVYTYAATAPLPENIDEYILAGFLRKKKVRLVKCITNDLCVPADSDIVIEGYVDPSEDPVWEGPFGDHTGFYSLADWYPRFHVTCITHSRKAVYPATIVGIPPQEDAWFAFATEKLFLSPLKLAVLPEIIDFHMPEAGTAHNLMIVKIEKSYPGQGMKVISSLSGAGQMMFTKYIVAVDGDVDIRNYKQLARHIFSHADFRKDIIFSHGPLDVLDHASDSFSFGGKAGLDATVKLAEERQGRSAGKNEIPAIRSFTPYPGFTVMTDLLDEEVPVVFIPVNVSDDNSAIGKARDFFRQNDPEGSVRLILAVDHTVDLTDLFHVTWQVLANSDPVRDHTFLNGDSLFIDGTAKVFRKGGFPRKWPNVVCSDESTIASVDAKWDSLGIGTFLESPSATYRSLCRKGDEEIHPL